MVELGKPKGAFKFREMEVDGVTMYLDRRFGDGLRVAIQEARFLWWRSLRIEGIK